MDLFFLLAALVTASITDVKSRTIPLWLFPSTLALCVISDIACGRILGLSNVFGFATMLLVSLYACARGDIGGGDLIMFCSMGWILGAWKLVPFTVAVCTLGLAVHLVMMARKKGGEPIPMSPLALGAYVICLILWR